MLDHLLPTGFAEALNKLAFRAFALRFAAWLLAAFVPGLAMAQIGHVLDGIGPVNQSMGGAAVGMPLDAMGALQWNPAGISVLRQREIGFAFAAFGSDTELASRVDANAFGLGVPGAGMQGSTPSDMGVSPLPAFAAIDRRDNSPWTFGLGAFGISGFGVDFAASQTNPILTPQRPNGLGFGAVYSNFQMLQFSPTIAYQSSRYLSVGFAPTLNWATLSADPFAAATPNANGSYPAGDHAATSWGLGFQAGLFLRVPETHWSIGLSYKSPQWFQKFEMNSADENGSPRVVGIDLDYPSILSVGLGYQGIDRLTLATDVRYIDYERTDGFEEWGYAPDGSVRGYGWRSIWAVSTGAAYELTPWLTWRSGYTFNQNPIEANRTFYNILSPGIVQHHLSTGVTVTVRESWDYSVTYKHGFRNSQSGRWQSPAGPVDGTNVEARLATHALWHGITRRF